MAMLQPAAELEREVAARSGQIINRCYQCKKCSAACPLTAVMDLLPHQLVRLVQLGARDDVLRSKTIWVCAACRTCVSRCPNGIDIAAIADALKAMLVEAGMPAADDKVYAFHQSFLNTLRNNGRLHELGMIARYKMKTKTYTQDLVMGLGMFRRGKLKLMAEKIRHRDEIERLFARSQEVRP